MPAFCCRSRHRVALHYNKMVVSSVELHVNQVNAVRALAQILRRYTSLNHLAQAARAVLQNSNQITQMLADINKVDFTSVQVRTSSGCQLVVTCTSLPDISRSLPVAP